MLELPRGWTDTARENAIVTALLMFAPVIEALMARNGIEQGRFSVDLQLFEDLYRACPQDMRVTVVTSAIFRLLPPDRFRQIFTETFHQHGLSALDKSRLTGILSPFLELHPEFVPAFEGEILSMLQSKVPSVRFYALELVGSFLNRVSPRDLARMKQMLKSKHLRSNAIRGFRLFLERRSTVDPDVIAFCASEPLAQQIRTFAKKDPDEHVRWEARRFLKELRASSGSRPRRRARA